ncbi:MAG: Mu transposase domain-containing protein [Methylovirgula sp.]
MGAVNAAAIGRPVEICACADRIALRQKGRVVGEHPRCYGIVSTAIIVEAAEAFKAGEDGNAGRNRSRPELNGDARS